MILSALTELHTKCWLIAKDHFADLIQYTQTQDTRFPKEANLVITQWVNLQMICGKEQEVIDLARQGRTCIEEKQRNR
jgi:hypothetical protein